MTPGLAAQAPQVQSPYAMQPQAQYAMQPQYAAQPQYGTQVMDPQMAYAAQAMPQSMLQGMPQSMLQAMPQAQTQTLPQAGLQPMSAFGTQAVPVGLTPLPVAGAVGAAAGATAVSGNRFVRAVKAALHELGLYKGEVNDVFDKQAKASVLAFQKKAGIKPTGKPTAKTRKALQKAILKKAAKKKAAAKKVSVAKVATVGVSPALAANPAIAGAVQGQGMIPGQQPTSTLPFAADPFGMGSQQGLPQVNRTNQSSITNGAGTGFPGMPFAGLPGMVPAGFVGTATPVTAAAGTATAVNPATPQNQHVENSNTGDQQIPSWQSPYGYQSMYGAGFGQTAGYGYSPYGNVQQGGVKGFFQRLFG